MSYEIRNQSSYAALCPCTGNPKSSWSVTKSMFFPDNTSPNNSLPRSQRKLATQQMLPARLSFHISKTPRATCSFVLILVLVKTNASVPWQEEHAVKSSRLANLYPRCTNTFRGTVEAMFPTQRRESQYTSVSCWRTLCQEG